MVGLKKDREFPPVCCFYGDSYLVEEAVKRIKERTLPPTFRDMNYNVFDAKEADADAVITIAQTFPVMSGKRLIVVNRAEALTKSQHEVFLSYMKSPAGTTCLIFIASDKVDKRSAFFGELDRDKSLFYFKPPSEAELPVWVKNEFNRLGKKISDDAAIILLEATGNELMDIRQEIEKIALFVGNKNIVEKKELEDAVASARIDTVFDLAESIGRKDLRRGIMNLRRLVEQGEQPVKILGMIARQFRIIWRVKALKKDGVAVSKIARMVRVFPTYLDGYIKQGRNFNENGLLEIFRMLRNADIALKSGRQSPHMLMERLVLDLCLKTARGQEA